MEEAGIQKEVANDLDGKGQVRVSVSETNAEIVSERTADKFLSDRVKCILAVLSPLMSSSTGLNSQIMAVLGAGHLPKVSLFAVEDFR